MKSLLQVLLAKICDDGCHFQIYDLKGKTNLFKLLPIRLASLKLEEKDRVLILMDNDSKECKVSKARLENIVSQAGIRTKTQYPNEGFKAITRLVIQSLEAWFLGDPEALRSAYPDLGTFEDKEKFRNPESLQKPDEALDQLLAEKRIRDGKVKRADKIAPFFNLDPDQNRCPSYKSFIQALELSLK